MRDLKQRGVLREGQVSRVAVIGPGLDFIDKNEASAYDYYPEQTVQPFALVDSLLRLRLAKANAVRVRCLISALAVLDHYPACSRTRSERHRLHNPVAPRSCDRRGRPNCSPTGKPLEIKWALPSAPIPPPAIFPGLETRAVRIRPDVVLACKPIDLNIILERLNLAEADRFDLVVATNIFVYYDAFEQAWLWRTRARC